MKIGIGYDIHRIAEGRRLVLGGVQIPYVKGLEGHSDADVLLHALCDAILGALGEDDIGRLFPDTDPKYANISSLILLKEVWRMASSQNFKIQNIDTVLIADQPKIDPFKDTMRHNISHVLNIDKGRVSIKATTNEGVGAIGRGEAIAAHAVILLENT